MTTILTGRPNARHQIATGQSSSAISLKDLALLVHELRAPLVAIQGLNALGEHETDLNILRDAKLRIDSIAEHALGVVNDILMLAENENHPKTHVYVPVTVTRLLDDVIAVAEPAANARGIQIFKRVDYDFPLEFMGDPQSLRQVLINLLTNAAKYSENGTTILLWATQDLANHQLCFIVDDEGPGLTQAEADIIFEPFARLAQTAATSAYGTGLGLPICRSIVKNLGGKITVESQVGKGSKFTVRLPVAQTVIAPETRTPASAVTEIHARKGDAEGRHSRILVVDDNEIVRDVLGLVLKNMGHSTYAVGDETAAIHALETADFDIILLDQNLGNSNGCDVARRIRQMPSQSNLLKVIGFSNHCTEEQRQAALSAGMDDFVLKTTRVEELRQLIQSVGVI